MAAFVLVVVVTALGLVARLLPGRPQARRRRPSQVLAADAVQTIKDDLTKISGPGFDLIHDDRPKALTLLNDAYAQLRDARTNGVPETILAPLRAQVLRGLETCFNVVPVASTSAFVFPTDKSTPDLIALVRGPVDGLPYVLDRAIQDGLPDRPQDEERDRGPAGRQGVAAGIRPSRGSSPSAAATSSSSTPRTRCGAGGRPTRRRAARSRRSRSRAPRRGAPTSAGIGTFQPGTPDVGAVPAVRHPAGRAADRDVRAGGRRLRLPGQPVQAPARAAEARRRRPMLIDGDIYLAQGGKVSLVVGRSNWKTGALGDDMLHPTADYTAIASSSHAVGTGTALRILDDDLGSGTLYAYDRDAARIVAFNKDNGDYQVQYRLANGDASWGGMRGLLPRAGRRLRRRPRSSGSAPAASASRRSWPCPTRRSGRSRRARRPRPARHRAPSRPSANDQAQADEEAVTRAAGPAASPPARRLRRPRRAAASAWDNPAMSGPLVEMVVESVRVHMLSSNHVVILKEADQERYLPIWIGPWEANAIAMKLQGLAAERPLTHDLFAADARGARRRRPPGHHLGPVRRHVPRPAVPRGRRTDDRDRRAPVRRPRAGRPVRGQDLRRAGGPRAGRRVARDRRGDRHRGGARRRRRGAGPALERAPGRGGDRIVDPRLDVFRDFINSLGTDPGGESRGPG